MVMVFIIIFAFATFFYIMNSNSASDTPYINDYGLPSYVNAIVGSYFVS